ncbi:hypothetical protein CDQ92_07595 [Sphingopyxis bauzanensis]|uniref:Uncharacterized protein n=1 Tax=Sphingopyxis bauzanensis TaxID=651663 RepID=A0A246JVK0_9SPHN|nr:hypothetical protein [Sphingopyxis bauzanensis]OWQ96956.1 hypothetical protein CDQ92_07595 [Sphingopyxis bauzanensis]
MDIDRFVEAHAVQQRPIAIDDFDAMMSNEMPLPDGVGSQRPRRYSGMRNSGAEIGEFHALMIDRVEIIMHVEEISSHRRFYERGSGRFHRLNSD